ncbi:MAG: ATP-binding protein [Sedimenticola sp.]
MTFVIWCYFLELQQQQKNIISLDRIASTITYAVWNYDYDGVTAYLRLFAKYGKYEEIMVFTEENKLFIDIIGQELNAFDTILIRLGLIPRVKLEKDIYYRGELIGRIKMVYFNDIIYLFLVWFIVFAFIIIVFFFWIRLFYTKVALMKQAIELKSKHFLIEESREKLKQQNLKLISIQQKLETETQNAKLANRSKSIFLANMSHELRTPLNAVIGFSEMLGRDCSLLGTQKNTLAIINRCGVQLLAMINDILDLSKIEAGKLELQPETIDLMSMLEEIQEIFALRAEGAGLEFNVEIDKGLVRFINVDAKKLRQILINLLGNAIKFTQKGGVLLRCKTVAIDDAPHKITLLLAVEDTGPGIAPEKLKDIFQPFMQAGESLSTNEGSGLGLSISRACVQLMGGGIGVESELGKGATFQVEIPVLQVDTTEALQAEPDIASDVVGLEPSETAWRIMVAEDNPENRLLLTSMLKQTGFDVREVENGSEAVTMFKKWQPHFIWMDMRMPVMSGYQASQIIRSLPGGSQVKIVAITASVFKEERSSMLAAGCNDIVNKPFQRKTILETMARLLNLKYKYEQDMKVSISAPDELIPTVTPEMISSLPVDIRNELYQATIILDINNIQRAINHIVPVNHELASALNQMVDKYMLSQLSQLLTISQSSDKYRP